MIISHLHKFVFLHNPKVAGSAIRKALEPFHDDSRTYWHQKYLPELDRVVDAAHLTFHDFMNVHPFMNTNAYRFLTVVRDPYKRFMSSVAEFLRQHPEENTDKFDLDEWIMRNMDETNFRFNWKYIHFCPQHYFVPKTAPSMVARHERLSSDWRDWARMIGNEGLELPKVRVRPDQDIGLRSLSPYAIREINRVYVEDFRRFGYEMISTAHESCSHYERVNGIHSPYLEVPAYERCTEGEKIAYCQKHGEPNGLQG